jgi:hypothetical protein
VANGALVGPLHEQMDRMHAYDDRPQAAMLDGMLLVGSCLHERL